MSQVNDITDDNTPPKVTLITATQLTSQDTLNILRQSPSHFSKASSKEQIKETTSNKQEKQEETKLPQNQDPKYEETKLPLHQKLRYEEKVFSRLPLSSNLRTEQIYQANFLAKSRESRSRSRSSDSMESSKEGSPYPTNMWAFSGSPTNSSRMSPMAVQTATAH